MSIMGNRKESDLPAITAITSPAGLMHDWRQRFGLQLSEDKFAFAAVIALILVALQIASLVAPAYIAPPPLEILTSVWHSLTVDSLQIAVTLARLLAALVFALVAGTTLGIVMGMFPRARPYLRALVLIDTGNPEVRIFFIMGVILIPFYALNVFDGVRALPKELVEMSESFRPSRWQMMRFLILPHIVAYVLMTTKSIIGYASRMVVFAELIGAAVGVGARMGMAQASFDMKVVLAWTVILVAFNLIAQQLVAMLESTLLRWRPDVEVR
jgi:NitT/TauT family transport system permease protein